MPGGGAGSTGPVGSSCPWGFPIPSPRSPGNRLPDGGRFLPSRLTARLNIAASTPGGRRSSRPARRPEPRKARRRRPEEEEELAQHRPGARSSHPAARRAKRRVARSVRPTGLPPWGPRGPAPGCPGGQGAPG